MILKKIFIIIAKSIGIILGIVAFYLLLVFALPYIEIPEKPDGQPKVVPIYIYTNGVHTDLVMPTKSVYKDWTKDVPYQNTRAKQPDMKYVAIGWGDKGFYLDTPTWADLKFSTAFKAAFWLSESAMHCTYYQEMKEGEDCKKIMLSEFQYRDLVKFVEAKFDRDASGKTILIPTNAVYGKNDAFYDAKNRYSFLNSCNTWVNDGLKLARQKAAFWTATDTGIFQHYR